MEVTKRAINDPTEGLRYRLADAKLIPPVNLDTQLRSAVHARLGLQAADGPRSGRRALLGRRRKATG
jgi:hypothetical protein